MRTEAELIEFINDLVREEHGMPMTKLTDRLVETGVDSFGVAMVMLEISREYDVYNQPQNENIPGITLGSIIKRIQDESTK